jgi:hypothetical protein
MNVSDTQLAGMYAGFMWALNLFDLGEKAKQALSETIRLANNDKTIRRLSKEELCEFCSAPGIFSTLSSLATQMYKVPVLICIKYHGLNPFLHFQIQLHQRHR